MQNRSTHIAEIAAFCRVDMRMPLLDSHSQDEGSSDHGSSDGNDPIGFVSGYLSLLISASCDSKPRIFKLSVVAFRKCDRFVCRVVARAEGRALKVTQTPTLISEMTTSALGVEFLPMSFATKITRVGRGRGELVDFGSPRCHLAILLPERSY